ncbi:FecR family protein [Pedobacter polaris]|uniref:FecR family protein n=1 Tax=Pedobacter polaris TaxID=2571273 RepID=A0A4U1CVB6_9SPHI|nr:FecR family protein [Pedobacter polaris]TKC12773.1 FecR family protein [Pedobacter polaris]
MQPNQIKELINRYLSGNCTEAESALVENSYRDYLLNPEPLKEHEILADLQWIEAKLPLPRSTKKLNFYKKISIAAALLIAVGGTLYFGLARKDQKDITAKLAEEKILPGTDRAILTLADGRKILLDKNASTLFLDSTAGIQIKKTKNGELIYEVLATVSTTGNVKQYNTIETPRGSQYTVILQDGTKVWLNASSFLKYPLVFSGNKRQVELNGEGYFEVSKNKARPFIVQTNNQEVEVLGTHFNVNAYPEEVAIKTTLLEGKVIVHKGGEEALMKPGEQVVNLKTSKNLKLSTLEDANEVIAWKNGLFLFTHESLYDIMVKISRWYDVEVEYQGKFDNQYYSGTISRFGEVEAVLKIMELTGSVKFKIHGRRIIVMK